MPGRRPFVIVAHRHSSSSQLNAACPVDGTAWTNDVSHGETVTDGLIGTRGIDLSLSQEHLCTAEAGAPLGTVGLCDTLLHCFGQDREDDITMLALRLRLG